MTENFIFVSLCDNDFGQSLAEGTQYIFKNKEADLTEEQFKYFVVNYVAFAQSIRRIHPAFVRDPSPADAALLKKYLEAHIKVSFLDKAPEVDHDGGSVVLDTNTGYVWQI